MISNNLCWGFVRRPTLDGSFVGSGQLTLRIWGDTAQEVFTKGRVVVPVANECDKLSVYSVDLAAQGSQINKLIGKAAIVAICNSFLSHTLVSSTNPFGVMISLREGGTLIWAIFLLIYPSEAIKIPCYPLLCSVSIFSACASGFGMLSVFRFTLAIHHSWQLHQIYSDDLGDSLAALYLAKKS